MENRMTDEQYAKVIACRDTSTKGRVSPSAMHDCADCGVSALDEFYMVWDEVWIAAGMEYPSLICGDGSLCIGCLEGRIGRQLNPLDFQPIPINAKGWTLKGIPRSTRLEERMGYSE